MADGDPDRFQIESRLGAGGMGVVFSAFDRVRGARVALKRIHHFDPAALLRFKNEFRSLADITHPNLVALHELLFLENEYLFTMELVDGATDFLRYVRPDDAQLSRENETESDRTVSLSAPATTPATGNPARLPVLAADYGRLRSCLQQVALGLQALHDAGKLHRDLKPGNILVSPQGRVLICDFGLITDVARPGGLGEPGSGSGSGSDLAGTPSYMSPEQVRGLPLQPASDWYAVGVLLYQSLTGRPPFQGRPQDVAARKLMEEPPAPSALLPSVPEDLDYVCTRLLQREPAQRLTGPELLRFLGMEAAARGPASDVLRAPIGRAGPLQQLEEGFRKVQTKGEASALLMDGPSGMGKSMLVRHFCTAAESDSGALVLAGRCYEHESVPYKAADGLVDALAHHLGRLDPASRQTLLPRGFWALARLFPVLQPLLPRSDAAAEEGGSSKDQRRTGFEALRLLLTSLAQQQPVILFVDDLQWGDDDSSVLLLDLLSSYDAPPVFFVGTYRSEDRDQVPLLRSLAERIAQRLPAPPMTNVTLAPLADADAASLLRAVSPEGLPPALLAELTREAAGSPYLLAELAGASQELLSGALRGEGARGRLDAMMRLRLEGLPEAARRLAEAVAVAGRPIPTAVAAQAARMGEETPRALTLLRASRLLRLRDQNGREELVTYHDRIRETARDALDPGARAALHAALAEAYVAHGHREPEILYEHWRGAGQLARALEQAVLAAEKSRDALAFDRAARFFGIALELAPASAHALAWQVSLAEALANSGQGQASAETYLRAVERAPPAQAESLRRLAANEYLRSGLVVEGRAVVDLVLADHGISVASSPLKAVAGLLLRRARLKLRGLGYTLRPEADVDPRTLRRLDALFTASQGLAFSQSVEAGELQVRFLLESLDAGEPTRLVQALRSEAGFLSLSGARRSAEVAHLLEQVQAVVDLSDPGAYLEGTVIFVEGLTAFHMGEWKRATERVLKAARIIRTERVGVRWEQSLTDLYVLGSYFMQGQLRELQRLLPSALNALHESGDVFGELQLHTRMAPWTHMMVDAPGQAREELAGHHGRWTFDRFLLPQLFRLIVEGHLDLYDGRPVNALARFDAARPQLRRSFLMRTETSRIQVHFMLGAASLGVPGAQARAQKYISGLLKEHAAYGQALGRFLEGKRSALDGQVGTALSQLEGAVDALDRCGMPMHAHAARWQLGLIRSGERGAAEVHQARQWMQSEGVRNPVRFVAALGVQG